MEIKVKEEDKNIRIDKFLSLNTPYSRELIVKMLKDEFILVNNKKVKSAYLLKKDDIILVKEGYLKEFKLEKENIPLDIYYEDDDIIVLNKPSGLVVHPASGNEQHTLVNALLYHFPQLSDLNGPLRPGIVHRLDKDTSGLMIVCKTNRAHEILQKHFAEKKVQRQYLALLEGVFPYEVATIDAPIKRDKEHFQRYTVSQGGKKAITCLEVVEKFKDKTLVKLELKTGRTHQIRVHMAYIGYPVYNDPVYTNKKCSPFNQFLHSSYLRFNHPITKKLLEFNCPLPKEFQDYLDQIKIDEEENKEN